MTEKGTELVVLEGIKTEVLFVEKGLLKKVVNRLKEKLAEFEPDTESTKGREEIASMSRKVSSSKVFLDGMRKDVIAKAKPEVEDAKSKMEEAENEWRKKKGKVDLIHENWRPIKAELDELRDKVRQPLTDIEAEEERKDDERNAKIKDEIDSWRKAYLEFNGMGTHDELNDYISKLEAISELISPELYFEFTTLAEETCDELLTKADQELRNRIRLDAEEAARKAEDARLKKVKADQDKIAAEQKAAQDKIDAAQKKIDDEKAEIEAEQKAYQERKDREEFERQAKLKADEEAKAAVAQAEADRIEKIEADRIEKERLEKLKPTVEKLNDYADDITKTVPPRFKIGSPAQDIVLNALDGLSTVANDIRIRADKL